MLADRTERYTMGDSSSVPIETAEELFKSIGFSIGLYMKAIDNHGVALLKTAEMQELLQAGWTEIEAQMDIGKALLQKVKDSAPQIDNISYHDTIAGISDFFKKYNYRFFAHEIPGNVDYQLCHAVSKELQGIEYINEYLRRLLIENEFCSCFDTETVILLLKSYCPDYQEMLINLYEPVATNAIGLALLNGDILALDIADCDRDALMHHFKRCTKAKTMKELKRAAEAVCRRLQVEDAPTSEYLKNAAIELYPRIEAAMKTNCLDGVFLSIFCESVGTIFDMQLIDGDMIDDDEMRELIDEIGSCRYVSDKIAIVKREIHCLRDLIEVLNVCFWADDCVALFDTLDNTELTLLKRFLQSRSPEWHADSGWDARLRDYL